MYRLIVALVTVMAVSPTWAVLTPEQQRCVGALNKDGIHVANTQGKESFGCVRALGKGLLAMTAEACLTADANLKLTTRKAKTSDDAAKFCANPPPFGFGGAPVINAVAQQGELNLIIDVFGANLDASAVTCATDAARCECQRQVLKAVEKLAIVQRQVFVRCMKSHVGLAAGAADLQRCVDDGATAASIEAARTSGGKVDKAVSHLTTAITKSCDMPLVTAGSFPGECDSRAGTALSACLAGRTSCRICQTLNDMDVLSVDCDTFDDGSANASCSPSMYPATPTPVPSETPTATPTATTVIEMLTINFSDGGTGRVSDDSNGISCTETCTVGVPQGTVVTLTADRNGAVWSPITGFYKWTGACIGTGDCVATINGPTSVEAWISPADLRIVWLGEFDQHVEISTEADFGHSVENMIRFRALAGLRDVTLLVHWEVSPNVRLVPPGFSLSVGQNSLGYFITLPAQVWDPMEITYVISAYGPPPPGGFPLISFPRPVLLLSGTSLPNHFVNPTCGGDVAYGTTGACYTHFSATRGIGVCQDGIATCESEPQHCIATTGEPVCVGSWGGCVGEVTPSAEICANGLDENCNGETDDGCP